MFYEPTTKALLSKFGGLSMVGYFEMASRMVQQFRALIVSANQVIVPIIADFQEKNPERIRSIYLTNYNLLFYLALPLYSLIIIATPLISELWIGHYERIFIIFGILLSIGWFLNTLNVSSYYANLGMGTLRWNVVGHVAIAVLNFILGVFWTFLDGYGVVIAWFIALSLGSAVICISYHLTDKIPLKELLPKDSSAMLYFFVFILIFSFVFQQKLIDEITFSLLSFAIFLFITFILLYRHPMRERLIGWGKEILDKR